MQNVVNYNPIEKNSIGINWLLTCDFILSSIILNTKKLSFVHTEFRHTSKNPK